MEVSFNAPIALPAEKEKNSTYSAGDWRGFLQLLATLWRSKEFLALARSSTP
jgi:hypothetical protein